MLQYQTQPSNSRVQHSAVSVQFGERAVAVRRLHWLQPSHYESYPLNEHRTAVTTPALAPGAWSQESMIPHESSMSQ